MIPGAGFPRETIDKMKILTESNFGIRIQHILNDQTFFEKFYAVNKVFRPHIVVFNNRNWPADSFTEFIGYRFHCLEGAVDSSKLAPSRYKKFPNQGDNRIIGGLANKNHCR